MRESGLTPAPVILDSRQQRFAARLANACSSKLKELHEDPSSGTPICRVVEIEREQGWTTKGMSWPAPGEEPVVKTIILDDDGAAKRAVQCWAKEKEAKVRVGVWMWWTDGSRYDDGRVGAVAVCKYGSQWRTRRSYLGTGYMDVFDAKLWAARLALGETDKKREIFQWHVVKTVPVFSNSQAASQEVAHLEPRPGHRLARLINQRMRALVAHGIATESHWVPGHSCIPENDEADGQVNLVQDASGSTVIQWPDSLASNRGRRISERKSAAKAKREADKCSNHFSYRLKGKVETKRPITTASVKSLAARFYRLQCGHISSGTYLKRCCH